MKIATIVAGTSGSIVNIQVMDDKIVEKNETFDINLNIPPALSPGVVAGSITRAIITIIDTTSKWYH